MSMQEDFEKYIISKNPTVFYGYDFCNDTYKFMGISETHITDMWDIWKERQKDIDELSEKNKANEVRIKELEKALKTAALTEEKLQEQNEQLINRMIRMVVENYGLC